MVLGTLSEAPQAVSEPTLPIALHSTYYYAEKIVTNAKKSCTGSGTTGTGYR